MRPAPVGDLAVGPELGREQPVIAVAVDPASTGRGEGLGEPAGVVVAVRGAPVVAGDPPGEVALHAERWRRVDRPEDAVVEADDPTALVAADARAGAVLGPGTEPPVRIPLGDQPTARSVDLGEPADRIPPERGADVVGDLDRLAEPPAPVVAERPVELRHRPRRRSCGRSRRGCRSTLGRPGRSMPTTRPDASRRLVVTPVGSAAEVSQPTGS